MSEALCGPSNALQQFQKHSQTDRTLQQDRLVSRRDAPLQGFRSADPNAGLLDPEFEAFQASQPSLLHFAEPAQLPYYPRQFQGAGPAFGGPSVQDGWAADFQRLQLSSPPPLVQHAQHGKQSAAQMLQGNTAFQNSSPQSHAPSYSGFQPSFQQQNYMSSYGGGFSNGFVQPNAPSFQQQQEMDQAQDLYFDEAAFERAFDEAQARMLLEEHDVETAASEIAEKSSARSPVDIYPYLALLRVRLFQCIVMQSEESTHDAALYISLLEQHRVENMSTSQLALFISLFASMHSEKLPFESRYSLSDRVDTLRHQYIDALKGRLDANETPGNQLSQVYFDTLQRFAQSQPSAQSTNQVATDGEMRSDLEHQLRELNKLPFQERVYQAVPREQSHSTLSPILQEIIKLEVALSSQLLDQPFQEQVGAQDDWSRLWTMTKRITLMPETIEAIEALSAQQDSAAMTGLYATGTAQNPSLFMQSQQDLDMLSEGILPDQQENLMGPDVAEQESKTEHDRQRDEDDELARTASDLLDKVADNKTDKFQNSAFLGLMRKLRDREMRVEGDKLVESSAQGTTLTVDAGQTSVDAPSYQPLQHGIGSNQEFLASHSVQQTLREGGGLQNVSSHASQEQQNREPRQADGQAVVDLLKQSNSFEAGDHDAQEDDVMMTSPFFEDENAQVSSDGLF